MLTLAQIYHIIQEHFVDAGDEYLWADLSDDSELVIGTDQRHCTIRVTEPGVSVVSADYPEEDEEDED